MPQMPDPLLDCMLRMRSVAAEHVPVVVTSDGRRSTSPSKGEFVTEAGLTRANTWTSRRIVTDKSTEATGVLPAMTGMKRRTTSVFSKTKIMPRVGPLFLDGLMRRSNVFAAMFLESKEPTPGRPPEEKYFSSGLLKSGYSTYYVRLRVA